MVWLEQLVFPANHEQRQNQCPLILVHGAQGLGKTAACRDFLKGQLVENPGSKPLFAFDWKGGVHGQSAQRFATLLFEMGVSNLSVGQSDKNLVFVNIQSKKPADPEDEAEHSTDKKTYGADGAPSGIIVNRQEFSGEAQLLLAEEFVERLTAWVRQSPQGNTAEALGKLVFFFDNFEDYNGAIRQWVGRYMYPAILSADGLPGCAYLFTGTQSWDHSRFVDSWNVRPGSLKDYRLSPLTPKDCKRWLDSIGVQEDCLDVLLEETEGIPGRIVEFLEQPDALELLRHGVPEDGVLAQFDAKERGWLHAASMQAQMSIESFELLLGREEASDALAWMRGYPKICRFWQSGGGSGTLRINSEIRSQILSRARKKIPMRHDAFNSRLDLLQSLSAKVPSEEHRHFLRMLAPVQPINEESIQFVHGKA